MVWELSSDALFGTHVSGLMRNVYLCLLFPIFELLMVIFVYERVELQSKLDLYFSDLLIP